MTTCVNQEKKGYAGKAVSATLAGVLAVGMVPVAAFAEAATTQGEEDSLELLTATAADAFSNGTVTVTDENQATVSGSANVYTATLPSDKAIVPTVSQVTPLGGSAVTVTTTDYTVKVVKAGSDGKIGTEVVTSITAAGTYYVVVTATAGTYAGGEATAKLTVSGADFSTITATDDGKTIDGETAATNHAVYDADPVNLAFKSGGTELTEGVDYTVKYYTLAQDVNNASMGSATAPSDAGTYYAVLTGAGAYTGKTAQFKFTIDKLTISNTNQAKVYVDQVVGDTTALPTSPTSFDGNTKIAAQLKLDYTGAKLNSEEITGAIGTVGKYTEVAVVLADENNKNITIGTSTNAPKTTVTKVSKAATITYDGAAFPETLEINLAESESYKETLIKVMNGTEEVQSTTGTDAGKYTITYEEWNTSTSTYNSSNASALTNVGKYKVTVAVNPDTDYKLGGSAEMIVNVVNKIDANASVYVNFNDKIVTSIEATYGETKKPTITVYDKAGTDKTPVSSAVLEDSKGTKTTISYSYDLSVDLSQLNAGSYTLTISTTDYVVENNVVNITIKPVDVVAIKLDSSVFTPAANTGKKGIDATKKYTVANILNNVTASLDDKDYDALSELAVDDEYELIISKDGKELKDTDELTELGTYTISVKVKDKTGNYVASAKDLTFDVVQALSFADVPTTKWYYDVVEDANALGYMNGDSNSNFFRPEYTLTRAEATAVIYKLAGGSGSDINNGQYAENYGVATSFTDVNDKSWEAGYISWAARNGIVTGYGDGTFRPSQNVTREEFAVMLQRYMNAIGKDTTVADANATLAKYKGGSDVQSWAKEAVAWACEAGLMGGDTVGGLRPADTILRAECAKMVTVAQPVNLAGYTADEMRAKQS